MRRTLALSTLGLTGLLAASCALPPKEAWTQIRHRGLIPVLIDARQTEVAVNTVKPSSQDAIRVQAVTTPAIVRTVYADAVPGRPGYVFSPHTAPRKIVDVRGYHSGEEVRCPFTSQPFIVPDFRAVAAASKPSPAAPVRSAGEVVSNTPAAALLDEGLARLEPPIEPPPATSLPVEPVKPDPAAAAAKPAIPYGARVPGRPGFVYSPHAARTQLVDVAGTAPGVVVKCPYTNKLFRVPEPNAEEITPSPFPATPATPPGETVVETPPAVPDKPAPGPVEPSPQPIAPPAAPGGSLSSPR
jgi:hypothetical protein